MVAVFGAAFALLAAAIFFGSVIWSLWLYPLN
jgi:hypothetical protein